MLGKSGFRGLITFDAAVNIFCAFATSPCLETESVFEKDLTKREDVPILHRNIELKPQRDQ